MLSTVPSSATVACRTRFMETQRDAPRDLCVESERNDAAKSWSSRLWATRAPGTYRHAEGTENQKRLPPIGVHQSNGHAYHNHLVTERAGAMARGWGVGGGGGAGTDTKTSKSMDYPVTPAPPSQTRHTTLSQVHAIHYPPLTHQRKCCL